MLSERTVHYYFDHLQGKRLNFECLCDAIRKRFLIEEHTRALLREWNFLTLKKIMKRNVGKKPSGCPELLVARLEDIQSGLTKEYREDIFLKNELLKGVKRIDAYKLAY